MTKRSHKPQGERYELVLMVANGDTPRDHHEAYVERHVLKENKDADVELARIAGELYFDVRKLDRATGRYVSTRRRWVEDVT